MNDAKQPEPVEKHHTPLQRTVEYLPPDPTSVRDYARAVCIELGQQNPAYRRSEVILGFTSFLSFVAERMPKYLNSQHKEYLLKGYRELSAVKR